MKKNHLIFGTVLSLGLVFTTTSCSNDNDSQQPEQETGTPGFEEIANLEYTPEYAASWNNYMSNVAALLANDANTLYKSWNSSYDNGPAFAATFKAHNSGDYTSAQNCIEQIIDGCCDIASEVGETKIGDPYNKYMAQSYTEALYAVESWYSWHSRDDYTNNIYSIRNSYYNSLDGTVNPTSLSALVNATHPNLNTDIIAAINRAAHTIQSIPQPFRNNIGSPETIEAMEACSELEDILDKSLRQFVNSADENQLDAIVSTYVDEVVLPTYKNLRDKNNALKQAVAAFTANPSNENFAHACKAWLSAREPWEKSEAFLFGPVDALGLDPNMDSWPLDQVSIFNILKSGNFNDLNWTDGDNDEKIEASQNVRGFHTLEYLLFKDGQPRTVK